MTTSDSALESLRVSKFISGKKLEIICFLGVSYVTKMPHLGLTNVWMAMSLEIDKIDANYIYSVNRDDIS